MAVISGFIILGVGEILAPILLGMMNVPDDVLKLATPATPILNTITNTRFRITFITPAVIRA